MSQNTNLDRLLRFDLVRVSKLLEEIQDVLVVFTLAFIVGSMIDKLFPTIGDPDEVTNATLIKDIALQLSLITIAVYYINKISAVIPFFFSLSNAYVPGSHGESTSAAGLACAIVFVGVMRNFQVRLGLLKSRFYPSQ